MAKFEPFYRVGCVINEKAHKGVGGAVNATWGKLRKEKGKMFISKWIFWVIGIIIWIWLIYISGCRKGDYDFVSPIIGWAIFLIGIAGLLGFLVAHC